MSNFVEFVYEDKPYSLNTDLIRKLFPPTRHIVTNEWMMAVLYTDSEVDNYKFDTESEAQALYDLLKGKKKEHSNCTHTKIRSALDNLEGAAQYNAIKEALEKTSLSHDFPACTCTFCDRPIDSAELYKKVRAKDLEYVMVNHKFHFGIKNKLDKIREIVDFIDKVLGADDEKYSKLTLINNSIINIKSILDEK